VLSVWYPARGIVDAMDATLTHLLGLARVRGALHEGEDDVRVRWGNIRSPTASIASSTPIDGMSRTFTLRRWDAREDSSLLCTSTPKYTLSTPVRPDVSATYAGDGLSRM
jgi:hypothetical protein